MKNIQIVLIAFLCTSFLFLVALPSCKKKVDCSGPPVYEAYFHFRLVDQYGINQIAAWGSRYKSDSVYVTKMDGTLPNQLEIGSDGNIVFFIPEDTNEAQDTFITRQFLLYLPDVHGHPRDDVDTIKFTYRFNITCYDVFQVFYNNRLYHDGQYTTEFISFIKN